MGNELARGTAAEYLVCADLILQGFKAFPANQTCAYDIAVEVGTGLLRVQVKSTDQKRTFQRREGVNYSRKDIYRFNLRRGNKKNQRSLDSDEFDILALVALDSKQIAYLNPNECNTPKGKVKTCLELRDNMTYEGRTYPNGKTRKLGWGRMFDAYRSFARAVESA